jgi:CubicO group peptidase (beta-lactamase class C family)
VDDTEIRRILVERVDTHRQSVGIIVGVVDASGRRVIAYGPRAAGGAPVDADTVFEIGSMTKVFTALLLAEMVQRGEVALTDPVAKHLPMEVTVPERGGRSIRLQDLATHTSGLPRLPDNMPFTDPSNPYADYTTEHLYQFLSSYQLTRDIGAEAEYSNLGMGLLGHALARRAGMDYETLVRTRITGPLGMTRTGITLTDPMRADLATGHSPALQPVPMWDLPALAGAGALRSTANDMLTFLEAALGYRPSPLAAAFAATAATRRTVGSSAAEVALGWQLLKDQKGTEIIWHNGGTAGFRTWAGYEPSSRTAVVVLTNAGTAAGPDDIGRHLLNPELPLGQSFQAPPKPRLETKVDPSTFDRYVGRYQFGPALLLTVSREGSRFFAQLTGQGAFEIFAESDTAYFVKVVDAQLTFETGAQGETVAVVLHQNGVSQRARRIDGEPVMPSVVAVDPAVLEGYVGRYQLAPGILFTITRTENRLFAQLTGQPPVEVFASSPREFFYKVVDAQLTFETDAQGKGIAVVLHQNGIDQRAPRIEGDAVTPAAVTLPPEVLQRYVGRYEVAPGAVMTVTLTDGRLFAQPTAQTARELVPTSEREFLVKEINAPITFEVDGSGRATALILLPEGTRAARME